MGVVRVCIALVAASLLQRSGTGEAWARSISSESDILLGGGADGKLRMPTAQKTLVGRNFCYRLSVLSFLPIWHVAKDYVKHAKRTLI